MKHKSEFDAPPLPHTRASMEPATRFTEARKRYEGTMGAAVVRAANWRLIAFAAMGLSVFLGCGLIYASSLPAAVPYYVTVDKTGAATNVSKADGSYEVKESSIEYFLGQTIMKLRMVPKDVVQYRRNGDEARYFITKDCQKKLESLMKGGSSVEDIKNGRVTDVELIGITKETGKGDSYLVRWKEKVFEGTSIVASYNMTAFCSVKLSQPTTEEAISHNPFGIYIDDISWSKER